MDTELRNRFLEGMSRAATFVAVATTDGDGGRCGVTISSLTSVSADGDQPSLLACIHHLSTAAAAILKNRAFCANLLHEGQEDIANVFAGRGGTGDHAQRFARVDWTPGALTQVCANVPDNCIRRWVTGDGSGRWTANYGMPGIPPDDLSTFDIQPGSNGWMEEEDADSDQTWTAVGANPTIQRYLGLAYNSNNSTASSDATETPFTNLQVFVKLDYDVQFTQLNQTLRTTTS